MSDTNVQGNCADSLNSEALDVDGIAPLDNMEAWQCAILTDMPLGSLGDNTWLHNLYIRHHRTTRDSLVQVVLWCGSPECNLWLTKVTLQGDGKDDPWFGGIQVTAGQMYADGTTLPSTLHAVCYVTASAYRIAVFKVFGIFGLIYRVKVPCLQLGPLLHSCKTQGHHISQIEVESCPLL